MDTPWTCIARTGTFEDSQGREHTFTEADLEAIRAGYDPAKSEAPLVLGHPKDNAPAYGWVKALKREGQKLFAQFAHVPAQVKELVQDRRYRYVSMSLRAHCRKRHRISVKLCQNSTQKHKRNSRELCQNQHTEARRKYPGKSRKNGAACFKLF